MWLILTLSLHCEALVLAFHCFFFTSFRISILAPRHGFAHNMACRTYFTEYVKVAYSLQPSFAVPLTGWWDIVTTALELMCDQLILWTLITLMTQSCLQMIQITGPMRYTTSKHHPTPRAYIQTGLKPRFRDTQTSWHSQFYYGPAWQCVAPAKAKSINQAQNLCLTCAVGSAIRLWNMDREKNWQWHGPVISHAISTPYAGSEMVWQDHQYHTIGDNWANRSTFPNRQSTTHFLATCADYPGTHLFHKHYIYPLMPIPAHLLPVTGSVHRAVHGELGFNRWKKTSVPVSLQHRGPLVVEITTTLSRSSAAVSEWVSVLPFTPSPFLSFLTFSLRPCPFLSPFFLFLF